MEREAFFSNRRSCQEQSRVEAFSANSQMDGNLVGDGMTRQNAVMALSGGMDSSSLLLHLIQQEFNVTCLSFDYGQKHRIELERAKSLVGYLKGVGHEVDHRIVDLKSAFGLFKSDLLESGGDVPEGHYEEDSMKATVVPNRNAIFSSLLYGTALSLREKSGNKSFTCSRSFLRWMGGWRICSKIS